MIKKTFGILTLLLILLISCGHSYNRFYIGWPNAIQKMKKVAVMPFDNLTAFPNAGMIISELFTSELYSLGQFKVIDSLQIKKILEEKNIEIPLVIDRSFAQEIGAVLGVDGIFIGSVSEYWYRVRVQETREEEPAVGVNARLVDTSSGAVVWASSCSRSSYSVFAVERESLNRIAQIIVLKMVNNLAAAGKLP